MGEQATACSPTSLGGRNDGMLIVLEGTEAVGKTTLANALAAKWQELTDYHGDGGTARILHHGYPDTDRHIYTQYAEPLGDERLRASVLDRKNLFIFDRYHLGDLLYGPLMRGGASLSTAHVAHLGLRL